MAGGWLKLEKITPDKVELIAIAAALKISRGDALLGCLRVWFWFDDHTLNGRGRGVTMGMVDMVAGHVGFAGEMKTVGWLAENPKTGVFIPDFDKHNGETAKARADCNQRVARHRARRAKDDWISSPLRREIFKRDNYKCVYCGFERGNSSPVGVYIGVKLGIDHIIPITKNGATTPENLVTCCSACNNKKGNSTPAEAGMSIKYANVTVKRYIGVTKPLPDEPDRNRSETEPENTEERISSSSSGEKKSSRLSGSGSSQTVARLKGGQEFTTALNRVMARSSGTRKGQRDADVTVGARWWAEAVWPAGIPDSDGESRLATFLNLARQAVEKDRPMAWLTERLKQELSEAI